MTQLNDLRVRLQRLRPLSADQLHALGGLLRAANIEMIYHSNALEGNALTLGETALVVQEGLTVNGKPLRDHLEAIDLADALGFAEALAAGREPLTERSLRELHALVLRRSAPESAGRYRIVQNAISGTTYLPPSPLLVPQQMQAVFSAYARQIAASEHPAIVAANLHQGIVDVHPFDDGNGRTARLAMNVHLLKSGYPLTIVRVEDRLIYIEAIQAARSESNGSAFRSFVADNVTRVLHEYLRILESAQSEP